MPAGEAQRRARALARLAAERAAAGREGGREARPGDLFALPETAAWPVEWAVVGQAPEEPERLLAVPADTHPLAGSGDVAVQEDEPGGPLTLRCRFALAVGRRALPPSHRSGLLAPGVAERAMKIWQSIREGRRTGTLAEEDADSSPDYREWIREVVEPAVRAMAAAREAGREDEPRPAGAEGSLAGPPSWRPRGTRDLAWRRNAPAVRWLGLAASLLLAVSLALGGGVLVLDRRLDEASADAAAEEASLRAQVDELAAARVREGEDHRREVERLTQEKVAAEERAEGASRGAAGAQPRPLVNLPFAWLRPEEGATRGEAAPVVIPAGSDLVVLILPLDDPGSFERFRLEIVSEASGRRVWSTDELVRTGLAEASLALPGSLLGPGDYVLRLSGLGPGGPTPLETYRLRIVENPA